MKRILALIAIAIMMLLPITVSAAESAEYVIETSAAEVVPPESDTADTAVDSKIPSVDEIKQKVLDTIDRIDWSLSGVELWEEVKTWSLNHLSTIVGVLAIIATSVLGLATKFSFVPKTITAFRTLGEAIKQWYTANIDAIVDFRTRIDDFLATMKDTIEKVERQSAENNELRHHLADALQENKELRAHYISVEAALLRAAMLDAQQHQRLVQLSGMSCADLDAEYNDYKARVEAIRALLPPDDVSDGKSEEGEP